MGCQKGVPVESLLKGVPRRESPVAVTSWGHLWGVHCTGHLLGSPEEGLQNVGPRKRSSVSDPRRVAPEWVSILWPH